jgi:hypothetical protein
MSLNNGVGNWKNVIFIKCCKCKKIMEGLKNSTTSVCVDCEIKNRRLENEKNK